MPPAISTIASILNPLIDFSLSKSLPQSNRARPPPASAVSDPNIGAATAAMAPGSSDNASPIWRNARRCIMATETLNGLKIAVLATDGFEQAELTEPRKALDEAGADTEIVSPKDKIRGWKSRQWGD